MSSFAETCAALNEELAATLGATDPLATGLQARAGRLSVTGPDRAFVPVAWRNPAGRVLLASEIRVLGINRGAELVTELLAIGHGSATGSGRPEVLAWARRVLTDLADRRRCAA